MKTLLLHLIARPWRGKALLLGFTIAVLGMASSEVKGATFNIETIHVHNDAINLDEGIISKRPDGSMGSIPQVEVTVTTTKEFRSKNVIARAYFFGAANQLLKTVATPMMATHLANDAVGSNTHAYIWPTVLPAHQHQKIFFPLPDKLPDTWKVVIVFGTNQGAVASVYPENVDEDLKYPEHDLVAKTALSPDLDIVDADPLPSLIEEKVQSDNPRYPAFTLLLHLPHGVTDPKQVNGVLATCIIADSVGQIRDKLNAIKDHDDPNPYFAYAEAHNMAILAWGARWVWSSYANFDELDKDQTRNWDSDFEQLANAWDRGVQHLVDQYHIPDHDYLMYGFCAGGEWVHRLALHKPDRFLAVQMHISTSYDAPTPEGGHVLWLLTTGELDGGCDRARRFYSAARDMNYPIIFKAVIGLGHADSPVADQLGIRFFDYALALRDKRVAGTDAFTQSPPLDLSSYMMAPFYGDLMNQEMFPAKQRDMIPPGFLVSLPTKEIADAWNK